jgi:hypothetical protein
MPSSPFAKFFIWGVILVLISESVGLWWVVFHQQQRLQNLSSRFDVIEGKTVKTNAKTAGKTVIDSNLLEQKVETIDQNVSSLSARVTSLEKKQTGTAGKASTSLVVNKNGTKEYDIFLGSGSTLNREWTDITSADAVIDAQKYGKIKEVRFEAALSIVGGEAHARLVNKTTNNTYVNSEVVNNTSESLWKTSSPLTLHNGSAEYFVQVYSTSGERASLDGARIRIILE